jgi:exopolysaccharide production protein ExoY
MLMTDEFSRRFLLHDDVDYCNNLNILTPNHRVASLENYLIEVSVEPIIDRAGKREQFLKRSFDISFALVFLIASLPVLIILAIALQVDSQGRLFFVQQRVGHNGKLFNCFKFRTMHEDAETLLESLLANCSEARREWDLDHKLRNDPRVTWLGGIVRKLSLDELPQLLNILSGEMSVVGPRPIVQAEISKYGSYFVDYCAVKPGLTGLWQVSGRNDVTYDERVQLDSEYRRKASFMFDFGIVLRTVPAVLGAKGSY